MVIWASHGGLRKSILKLFGSDASSEDLKDRVGHISDLLYYYALLATALTIIIFLLKLVPGKIFAKLHDILPNTDGLLELLFH